MLSLEWVVKNMRQDAIDVDFASIGKLLKQSALLAVVVRRVLWRSKLLC